MQGFRLFFVFQAEDGIRDADVTGVQTCALPISKACRAAVLDERPLDARPREEPRPLTTREHAVELDGRAGRPRDDPVPAFLTRQPHLGHHWHEAREVLEARPRI